MKGSTMNYFECIALGMTEVGAEYLGKALQYCQLVALDVSCNKIGNTGLQKT